MTSYESWVDRLIKQAQERGQFDNLPGKGKPLNLEDDALTDPEWRLANRLLKNAGFAPEWIEIDREVRRGWDDARAALLRSRAWRAARLQEAAGRTDPGAAQARERAEGEWRRAARQFQQAVAALNRQIDSLNLKVPALQAQRPRLNAAAELERLAGGAED
jgi:DnaJ family protein C protein 28